MSFRVALLCLTLGCHDDGTRPSPAPSGRTDLDTAAAPDTDTDDLLPTTPTTPTEELECQDIVVAQEVTGVTVPATDDSVIRLVTSPGGDSGTFPEGGSLFMLVDAVFGVNVTGCLDEVLLDGVIIDPSLNVYFGNVTWVNSGFDLTLTEDYCTVSLLLASGVENPAWATDWYAVEHDGVSLVTDCAETPFGDPTELLGPMLSAVSIGGPISGVLLGVFDDSNVDPYDYFASELKVSVLAGVDDAPTVAFGAAYAVDANQNVILTGGEFTQLDPATLLIAPGRVREGLYYVRSAFLLDL